MGQGLHIGGHGDLERQRCGLLFSDIWREHSATYSIRQIAEERQGWRKALGTTRSLSTICGTPLLEVGLKLDKGLTVVLGRSRLEEKGDSKCWGP